MDAVKKFFAGKNGVYAAEAVFILILMCVVPALFDYHYAMNDDVLIDSIVSGRYSGTPDVHNIQMISILNMLFNLLYRIAPVVPWFSFFMIICQYAALYCLAVNLTKILKLKKLRMCIVLAFITLLYAGTMISDFVMVQYTFTAGLLMASAAVQHRCIEYCSFKDRKCILKYVGIILQYFLAFCVRTEVFWFLLPFSLLLAVVRYYRNNGLHVVGRKLLGDGIVWGSILVGVLALYAIDLCSYGSAGWKEYREIFSCRTELYDFLALPAYDENREFYESASITKAQYDLLDTYNYSLDEEITADTMQKIVDYANEKRLAGSGGLNRLYLQMFTLPLGEGLWSYGHRALYIPALSGEERPWGEEYPWNIICILLYLVFFVLTCCSRRWMNLLFMTGMIGVRSVSWMYIILKQRTPARVTHSLFVMEMACLLLLIFEELWHLRSIWRPKGGAGKKWISTAAAGALILGACRLTADAWGSFREEYAVTTAQNREWYELQEYFRENSESFYFVDVYSMVNYSEMMFDRPMPADGERGYNYDICGGWLAKSPLTLEKYRRYGISSVEEALLENGNVYFVAARGRDLEWLAGYYAEKGIRLEMELQEQTGSFDVYRLRAGVKGA
ncbi:MAG: hypothetical protein K2O06_10705 [Acetatifactor sp.]|nr:hypothetical protein [Acetatifactor sp.]